MSHLLKEVNHRSLFQGIPRFTSNAKRFKAHLAGYMRPKKVIFAELPKTSTGKIRKNELRDLVRQKR